MSVKRYRFYLITLLLFHKNKSEIEFSLEDIGENAYDITQLAINYTKQQNKGINYLKAILNNWSKEKLKQLNKHKKSYRLINAKQNNNKSRRKNSFWKTS